MNASAIQRALNVRHANDLYISECKNGPTQSIGARPIRLDGWAFLKTWSPVTSIGYEVKVSRSDFIGDNKWADYLNLCHLFYFVAPKGLIQIEELPESVGLVEALGGHNGGTPRLVTRRKAQRLSPDPSAYQSLLHYVLMCRVKEGGTWVSTFDGRQEDEASRKGRRIAEWRQWLSDRDEARQLGKMVSRRVADDLREMQRKVERADALVRFYDDTRNKLRDLGFNPDAPIASWNVQGRIAKALQILDDDLVRALSDVGARVDTAVERIKAVRDRALSVSNDVDVQEARSE
jgi:hypothetical protein